MRVPQALLLASFVLLSGCSGNPGGSSSPEAEGGMQPSGPEAPAVPETPEGPMPPLVAECTQTRTQAATPVGLGLYLDRAALGMEECFLDEMADGNLPRFSSGLLEVAWTDLQETVTAVDAWLEASTCQPSPLMGCGLPRESGSGSPLRIEIDAGLIEEWQDARLQVLAAGQGLAVGQEFTFYLTMFHEGEPPSRYTAVPE